MFTARTSMSIGRVVLIMICVLGLRGAGWTQNPPAPASKSSGNVSLLRNEPALQVKLTVNFNAPKAQEIIDRLRAETNLDLMLADNIDQKQPALGSLSCHNVPAWIILDELAKSPIIQGKWECHGNGYRLTSPLLPADLAKEDAPSPAGPAKLGQRYFLFTLPLLAIFGVLLLARRWRRSQQTVAVSAKSAAPKSPASDRTPTS